MTTSLKAHKTPVHYDSDQNFIIKPFPILGAEIIGIDLSQALNLRDLARIKAAYLDHHLLIFRNQDITPEQQIEFSRLFGTLQIHVLHQFQLPGHPEIMIISNIKKNDKPIGLGDAGAYWHSDLSYKEVPSLGSLLYARQLPTEGGDTHFADMHQAWATLPEHLQTAIEGKFAEHTYIKKYAELQAR